MLISRGFSRQFHLVNALYFLFSPKKCLPRIKYIYIRRDNLEVFKSSGLDKETIGFRPSALDGTAAALSGTNWIG